MKKSTKGGDEQREREKQIPCRVGNLTPGSTPGLRDHDLSQRQMLNQLSHPVARLYFSY